MTLRSKLAIAAVWIFAAGAAALAFVAENQLTKGREDLWLVCDLGMIACFAGALVCIRSLTQRRPL